MIYTILYTLIELLNFSLAYKLVLGVRFRRNKWIYFLTLAFICLIQVGVLVLIDDTWIDMINMFLGFLIPIVFVEKTSVKWIAIFPLVNIGTSLVNILGSYVLAICLGIRQEQISQSHALTILSEMTAILIMLAVWQMKKKMRFLSELKFSALQYLLLFMGLLAFGIVIGALQWYETNNDIPERVLDLTGLAVIVIGLIFVILSVWHGLILRREFSEREKNKAYESFLRMQEEYIHMVMKRDDNLRKFRHDLQAHLMALRAHAREGEDDLLEKYIDQMEENSGIYRLETYSGIVMLDAVLTELVENARRHEINIKWSGLLAQGGKIEVYDLCTIFFNLVMNAIEAAEKLPCTENRMICIRTYQEESRIFIVVQNACDDGKLQIDTKGIKTSKKDTGEHGFGLQNVKETVQKYGGYMKFNTGNGLFKVEILL